MTKELGETVVGFAKPVVEECQHMYIAIVARSRQRYTPLVIFLPRYTFATSSSISLSPFSQMSTIFAPGTQSLETSARTFSEIWAAVLYLVRVSGLLREWSVQPG